ncbi:MAG: methyltransferase domain-containing protein [bacterium]|nr:methyltransferase domain-containing protein [bacterium]
MFNSFAQYYNEIFPLKKEKLNFIKSHFPLTCKSILDIGCATGEFALALAKESYSVIGIDLESDMIKLAEQNSIDNRLEYFEMNMTDVLLHFKEGSFDSVLCLGNTLALLGDVNLIENEINLIRNLLKQNGMFICQIVNFEKVLKEKHKKFPVIETDKIKFERFYEFIPINRIEFTTKLLIKETNDLFAGSEELYPVQYSELQKMLHNAGFKNNLFFGDFKGNQYNEDSGGLISVSRIE